MAGNAFSGKDLFAKAKAALQLAGGIPGVDDTVIDKPYIIPAAPELVGFLWSGLHHKCAKGINLIVFNYTGPHRRKPAGGLAAALPNSIAELTLRT